MLPQRLKFVLDKNLTVANLLDKAATARPDKVVFTSDGPLQDYGVVDGALTTAELRNLVNRISNVMVSSGIALYDRVGIWKANSLDYVFHSWATMRLGGIAVPVNGGMPVTNLYRYLQNCDCKALVTDRKGLEQICAATDGFPQTIETVFVTDGVPANFAKQTVSFNILDLPNTLKTASPSFEAYPLAKDQDVLICHTSGTTGFPKGVLHCSESLVLAAKAQLKVQFITTKNVAMTAAWMNHHIALSGAITSVTAGMLVHTMVDFEPEHLLEELAARRVNVFFAFPDIYQKLCRAGLENYDLTTIRMWLSGGDAMHEVHIRQLVKLGRFFPKFPLLPAGSMFCELLGTSEVGMVALMKMSTTKTTQFGRCVGKRTPFSPKVKVADSMGVDCKSGQVGRLMVKGPTLFKGYWNQHDRLHGVVRDGWWATGDLAFRDSKGRFFQIDREVDVIQGANGPVYTLLVEEQALKLDGVIEATVVSTGSDTAEIPTVILQIDPTSGLDSVRGLELLRAANDHCKDIERVVIIYGENEIPRGLTGKVLKRQIRSSYQTKSA